ncbi:nuclear matrix protein [Perilla frutescens var. frutescens]|nr:nuclear matrix protein [Perilla frutescens var. frutescens]
MAAKQMEEVQKKLAMLNYSRANAPAQSLLFAGMERYALLEWLFFKYKNSSFLYFTVWKWYLNFDDEFMIGFCRLLGDKSPFSQQNLQGDAVDRDEETSRIQCSYQIAKFLGITTTIDTEAIQVSLNYVILFAQSCLDLSFHVLEGRGSYEDRTEMLRLIVDLVEASIYADNPEWSVDEQVAKDIQLIDAIAEKQAQIFSEECKLFPADVQIQSIYPLPDISDLEKQLSDQSNRLLNLQEMVDDLASKHPYNPDEDYMDVEAKLRAHLESFLETARSFNTIYTKEIRPWTHMMEVPQLHGFGPAANRLLEAYKMLLKFLGNLKNLRDSHAAVAVGSSETVAGEPSSVMRIISECETALTFLNRDLGVLSASISREKGEEASLIECNLPDNSTRSCILLYIRIASNPSSDGFSIDLIYRDSLVSSLHNSTAGYSKLIKEALQRSKRRADYLASGTPTTDLIASGGEFLMKLSVGTPPSEIIGILDTSAVLSWTQCAPCDHCFPQKQPLFTPRNSSTYKVMPGNSKPCKSLGGMPSTSGDNTCRYSLFYLERYHSRGVISTDTVAIKTTSGTPTSQPNFVFGCGYDNVVEFKEASGVIGLGAGPSSLITQLNSVIGGKFSYCLVYNAHSNPKSSKMHFGSRAAVSGASVVSTGLQVFKNSYALTFKGMSVGNMKLGLASLSNSSSKISGFFNQRIIVDSGTTLTYIPKNLYIALEAAMRKQMKLEVHPDAMQRLCYKTPGGEVRGPMVTVHFVGANVKLYPINTFLKVSKNVHCLGFEPHRDGGVAILGNLAQVNFLVGFDLRGKAVSFKRTDCNKV